MFFQLSLSFVLLTFCHWTSAQVPFPNQCPEVKIVEDFKLDDYMGIWYEYAKYPFVFEIGKKCMYARYENTGDGFVSVMNAAVSKFTGAASNVTGKAKVIGSGQLAVVFPASRNQNYDKPNYLVLGTDYTSFVVVYSCANFTPVAHTKIVWILTRERKPSDAAVAAAKKVMDDNKLSQTFLLETPQDDCPDPNGTANADEASAENSDETMVTAEAAATTVNANTEPNLTTTNSIDKA